MDTNQEADRRALEEVARAAREAALNPGVSSSVSRHLRRIDAALTGSPLPPPPLRVRALRALVAAGTPAPRVHRQSG